MNSFMSSVLLEMSIVLHYVSQTIYVVYYHVLQGFSYFTQSLLDNQSPPGENVDDEKEAPSQDEGKIVNCIKCM